MKLLCRNVLFTVLLTLGGSAWAADDLPSGMDARTPIVLQREGQALVMEEMRQTLANVQLIAAALARDDFAAAAKAARASGMAAAHATPPVVREAMPLEFRKLGFSMHQDFDQLALDAESLGDMRHSLNQLGNVMQKCVACHATYRIVVEH